MATKLTYFVDIKLERRSGKFKCSPFLDCNLVVDNVHMEYSILLNKNVEIDKFETTEKPNARFIRPTWPKLFRTSFTCYRLIWATPSIVFENDIQANEWVANLEQIMSDLQEVKFAKSRAFSSEKVFLMELSNRINVAYSKTVSRDGLTVLKSKSEWAEQIVIPCADGSPFITYWEGQDGICDF